MLGGLSFPGLFPPRVNDSDQGMNKKKNTEKKQTKMSSIAAKRSFKNTVIPRNSNNKCDKTSKVFSVFTMQKDLPNSRPASVSIWILILLFHPPPIDVHSPSQQTCHLDPLTIQHAPWPNVILMKTFELVLFCSSTNRMFQELPILSTHDVQPHPFSHQSFQWRRK